MATTLHSRLNVPTDAKKVVLETYNVRGKKFQLKLRESWDGSFYWETGDDWPHTQGFGHPAPGRHTWKISPDGRLQQTKPGVICCHYPITVSESVRRQLLGEAAQQFGDLKPGQECIEPRLQTRWRKRADGLGADLVDRHGCISFIGGSRCIRQFADADEVAAG